jgi:23S rRNA (guanosine2251-2'-O)-methyltransferase
VPYADVEEICQAARAEAAGPLVVLDGVVDPRNLGAAIRSCAAAGATGVLLGAGGSAGLTPAAVKASAGTVERVPVGREPHPARRLRALGEEGFQVVGLDARGGLPWDQAELTGRLVLVAGGEERGLRPSLSEACNIHVAIPLFSGVESLNVAVALGVLLFEAVRQRRLPNARD